MTWCRAARVKPRFNIAAKYVQLALTAAPALLPLFQSGGIKVFLNGVPTDAQFPGDLALAQPLPLHYMYVQNGLLFFNVATSLLLS